MLVFIIGLILGVVVGVASTIWFGRHNATHIAEARDLMAKASSQLNGVVKEEFNRFLSKTN